MDVDQSAGLDSDAVLVFMMWCEYIEDSRIYEIFGESDSAKLIVDTASRYLEPVKVYCGHSAIDYGIRVVHRGEVVCSILREDIVECDAPSSELYDVVTKVMDVLFTVLTTFASATDRKLADDFMVGQVFEDIEFLAQLGATIDANLYELLSSIARGLPKLCKVKMSPKEVETTADDIASLLDQPYRWSTTISSEHSINVGISREYSEDDVSRLKLTINTAEPVNIYMELWLYDNGYAELYVEPIISPRLGAEEIAKALSSWDWRSWALDKLSKVMKTTTDTKTLKALRAWMRVIESTKCDED